jgi:hypothetical protein
VKHPPYHLRPNKAVDRLLLIEVLRLLDKHIDLSEYTYYGFGGPYLEEFRLLYDLCPQIKEMISIEEDNDTYKRQKFHLPCGKIRLKNVNFRSFLAQYEAEDQKSIFWLDYTRLEYGKFEEFMTLLGKVATDSIVKISLPAHSKDFIDKEDEFRLKFDAVMPDPSSVPPRKHRDFAILIQSMLQIAAQKVLPTAVNHTLQIISSFYYSDGTNMITVTGIVCKREEIPSFVTVFGGWSFVNMYWRPLKKIDVPILSTKERFHLAQYLPCEQKAGITLQKILGYLIDDDIYYSRQKMKQYADFHRYSPYFVQAIP